MTDIIEGNKLIAAFDGGYVEKEGPNFIETWTHKDISHILWEGWYTENLEYHSSWDWLMPVVEKIEGEHGKLLRIEGFVCQATAAANENPRLPPFNIKRHTNKKIDSVWQVVVLFIQWYNESCS